MTIDFSKPVQLTDGRNVRIVCTDAPGEWSVIGIVDKGAKDRPFVIEATTDGYVRQWFEFRGPRLENVPEPRFTWLNVYPKTFGGPYPCRDHADSQADGRRLHVLQVNLDTGETVKHAVGDMVGDFVRVHRVFWGL